MLLADLERRASTEEREKWEQKRLNAAFFSQNRKSPEETMRMHQKKKLIHCNLWQPSDEFKPPRITDDFRAEEEQDMKVAENERVRSDLSHAELAIPGYQFLPASEDSSWNQTITTKFWGDYQRGFLHMDEPPAELLIGSRPSANPHGLSRTTNNGSKQRKIQQRPKQYEAHAAVEAAGSAGFLASVDRSKLHKLPQVVKFFHPTRWTVEEVALVREMLQVYGRDWTLVAGLLGKSKTAQVLKNTFKSCQGNWDNVPTISVLDTACATCSGSFSLKPMVFCSYCDKGYHISCTDPPLALIPTDGDWFCSPECCARHSRCEACGGDRSSALSSTSDAHSSTSSAVTPNSSAAATDVGDALGPSLHGIDAMDLDPINPIPSHADVPAQPTSSFLGEEQFREMVQCDRCSKSWHAGCLTPKLESVPEGDWICPRCSSANNASSSSPSADDTTSQHRLPKCEHPANLTSTGEAYKSQPLPSNYAVTYRPLDDVALRTIVSSLQTLPWSYLLALSRICLGCHFAKFAHGSLVPRDVTVVPNLLTALDLEIQAATPDSTMPDFFRGSILKYAKREEITVTVPTLNNELMQVHFGRLLNTIENTIDKMVASPVFQLDKNLEQELNRVHKKQLRETLQATVTPLESVGRRSTSASAQSAPTRIPHTGLRATDSRRPRKRSRVPVGSFDPNNTIMVPSPDGSGAMVPAPAHRQVTSAGQTSQEEFNREDGYSEHDYRYWIFQANPQLYDINSSVKMLPDMTWFVKQHINRIRKGDRVFIWESGKNAGVIGTGTVKSDPVHILEVPGMLQFTLVKQLFDTVQLRCHVHIDCVLPVKVLKPEFQGHPILCQLTILRAPIGTNFRITKSQGLSMDQLIRDRMAIGGGTVHPDPNRLPTQYDITTFLSNPATIVTQPSSLVSSSTPPMPHHHGTARTRAAAAAAQQRAAAAAAAASGDSASPPPSKRRRVNSATPPSASAPAEHYEAATHVHTSARTQEYGKQRNKLENLVQYKEDDSPFLPEPESTSTTTNHATPKPTQTKSHVDEFEVEDVEDDSVDETHKARQKHSDTANKRSKISPPAERSDVSARVKEEEPPVPYPSSLASVGLPGIEGPYDSLSPSSPVRPPPAPITASSPGGMLASSPSGPSAINMSSLAGLPPSFSLDTHHELGGVGDPDDAVPHFDTHEHHLSAHMDEDALGVDPSLDLNLMHHREHDAMVDAMLAGGSDDLQMGLDSHPLLLAVDDTKDAILDHPVPAFDDDSSHVDHATPDSKTRKRKRADHFLGPIANPSPRPHNTRTRVLTDDESSSHAERLQTAHHQDSTDNSAMHVDTPMPQIHRSNLSSDMMEVDASNSMNEVLLVAPLATAPNASHTSESDIHSLDHMHADMLDPSHVASSESGLFGSHGAHPYPEIDQQHTASLHEDSMYISTTPLSSSTTTGIGSPVPNGNFLESTQLDSHQHQTRHADNQELANQACASCGAASNADNGPFHSLNRSTLCKLCTFTYGQLENLILVAGLRELWTEVERLVQIKTDYAIRMHRKNIAEAPNPQEMVARFEKVVRELRDGKSVMVLAATTSFNNFRERVQKKLKRDAANALSYQ